MTVKVYDGARHEIFNETNRDAVTADVIALAGRALGLIAVIDGPATYGILGVGALGEAIVTGLCREVGDAPAVVLSPRSASTAAALAAAHPTVRVAGNNQDVVDDSDVVVVCLRQTDMGELAELSWRPDQVVVSCVAGLSGPALAHAVSPAMQVARAVPMPAVAWRGWATPVRPPVPAAMALFERLGGAIPIEGDEQYDAIFTGLGTVAPSTSTSARSPRS